MNFNKRVNGSWVDTPHYIHNTSTDTITTPADIYANDTTATVGLKGQMVQSSVPSPTSPVMPQGTGDRTGNLWDEEYPNISGTTRYIPLYVGEGSFTLSTTTPYDLQVANLFLLSGNVSSGASTPNNGAWLNHNVTAQSDSGYITIAYRHYVNTTSPAECKTMLNTGSTAIPYEPWGIKIPILSNSTTTPVYLGQVQSTRRIKKVVLDGTETFTYDSEWGSRFVFTFPDMKVFGLRLTPFVSTHYQSIDDGRSWQDIPDKSIYSGSDDSTYKFFIKDTTFSSVSDFANYLASQYAAGTPVCVWYVLATPTTGVLNEPIRKIGDYADEVSDITIPTIVGANTIDVDTTLKPSEVSVNYHGWHPVADVHVYPDSSWMPTSWEEFRKAVRSGKAQSLYPIGTKLYENWGDETSNAWIVVDYPNDNRYIDSDLAQQGYTNRVMLMEEKLNYLRVFDAKEAWLYVETAIPAGTYRFTIPNYDTSYGGNKTYIFTSTANVPVGGQLTLTWAYNTDPTKVQGYSSSTSTTALFDVNIAEWDGTTACTDLGTIKLAMADADSTYGKLNHIHRARYGSNNYYQSGLRQWLNADATANNWWTPSNIFDRPYDNRNTAGRLNALNSNMKTVLATPTVNCITNNLFEYPSLDGTTFSLQTAYTVKDKLFLVTHTETNLSSTPNVDSVLAYYTNAQNADRIKYRKDNGNAYYWWLRTPYPTYAINVRVVFTSGALGGNVANGTIGSAAACIIQ